VKTHSVVGCISLYKRFLLDLGSEPRCCADGNGDEPPVSKGCFIVLAKSDVLRASHCQVYDAAGKVWIDAILRQQE
jgi:hypothetical protein